MDPTKFCIVEKKKKCSDCDHDCPQNSVYDTIGMDSVTVTAWNTLTDAGYPVQVRPDKIHLVVFGKNEDFDFWPRTGLYLSRKNSNDGRGLYRLLKTLSRDASK